MADSLRTLSSQYQRIAAEAEIARAEQDESLDSLMGMEVTTLDSAPPRMHSRSRRWHWTSTPRRSTSCSPASARRWRRSAAWHRRSRLRIRFPRGRPSCRCPKPREPKPERGIRGEYEAPEVEPIELERRGPSRRPRPGTSGWPGSAGRARRSTTSPSLVAGNSCAISRLPAMTVCTTLTNSERSNSDPTSRSPVAGAMRPRRGQHR